MIYNAIPGEKFCRNCYSYCQNLICESTQVQHDECTSSFSSDYAKRFSISSTDEFIIKFNAQIYGKHKAHKNADMVSVSIEESRMALHGLNKKQKAMYAIKLSKTVRGLEKTFTDLIGVEQYMFTDKESTTTNNDIEQKAKDFDMLVSFKETMQSIKSRDGKKNLKPESWSICFAVDYFNTRHYVKESMLVK